MKRLGRWLMHPRIEDAPDTRRLVFIVTWSIRRSGALRRASATRFGLATFFLPLRG